MPTGENTVEFNPEYLRKLMPSSRKKTDLQLLKRFKNKCMQLMEESAKADRMSCCYTLATFEMGLPLNYNLEQMAERLCRWLRRKGFNADIDEDNPLCINISWFEAAKQLPAPQQESVHPTVGAAVPLIRPPQQYQTMGLSAQMQGPQAQHPWFAWMNQPALQPKTPVKQVQPKVAPKMRKSPVN